MTNTLTNTLGLDLGTKTGWCVSIDGKVKKVGTWVLASKAELDEERKTGLDRRADVRFFDLFDKIAATIDKWAINRVVFEDVQFSTTTAQTQLWASLRSAIWAVAKARAPHLEIYTVPVATLKKFATGHGTAEKSDMFEALLKVDLHLGGELSQLDDNAVDATWLALYSNAVDEGRVDFSSVYAKKQEAKKECKEKNAGIRAAVKGLGRCPECNVLYKKVKGSRVFAACPNCGNKVRFVK